MSIQLQHRRGTEAENAAFVGQEGEITYATDTKILRIHDGVIAGGKIIGRDEDANKSGQIATLSPVAGSNTDYEINLNGIAIDFTKSWRVYVQVNAHPLPSASQTARLRPPAGSGYTANYDIAPMAYVSPRFGVAAPLPTIRSGISVQQLSSLSLNDGIYEFNCVVGANPASDIYYYMGSSVARQTGIVQSELATETFTANSNTDGSRNIILGGGQYGFNVQITCATAPAAADYISYFAGENLPPTLPLAGRVNLYSLPVRNYTIEQRYITASPPYDLGDGDIHGMLYLVIKKSDNSVIGHWAGRTPPWIYNGANKATADVHIDGVPHIYQRPSATIENIRNNEIPEKIAVPLTTELKNADMAAIPQPFLFADPNDEYKVIIADPMDDCLMCMLDELNHGNSGIIQEIVDSSGFRIDNDPLSRAAPPGVPAHRIRF